MFNQFSLRFSLALGVIIMGALAVIMALYVDVTYRRIALENQQLAIQEIIRLRSGDLLIELERYSRDLGQSIQSNSDFRYHLEAGNAELVEQHLKHHFHQYFVTAGILKLNSLIAHDQTLNVVGISMGDDDPVVSRGGETCPSLMQRARSRRGVDRYKVTSEMCLNKGYPYMHVLIPIGGLQVVGYLEVVTDPTYTLSSIEKDLGMPLKITFINQNVAYQSVDWPSDHVNKYGILASYIAKTSTGKAAFKITVLRDVNEYELQLKNTRNALMLTVVLVTMVVASLMLFFIKKTTLDPLNELGMQLTNIRQDSNFLGQKIETTGNSEVRALASGFNEMTSELKTLYDELQLANQDLKAQIKQRERAEIELKLSRDHLEDLVETRTAALAVARDAALRASQSKSQFLANMSHELRTPLNAIIGYTEILLEDARHNGESDNAKDLRKVHSAARHLFVLIKDVLDLTKIEAGKIELDLTHFDVNTLLSDLANTIEPMLTNNNNYLEIHCEKNIGIIHADATKVRQVILNLLSNAAKFTQNGLITVRVTQLIENNAANIVFSVSDTGIGLTQVEMMKVFDAFTQADSSTTREYGGTGLGLAISRNYCQLMGGDLSVTSEKGVGSTFTVVLPSQVKNTALSSVLSNELPVFSHDDVLDPQLYRMTRIEDSHNYERRINVSSILVFDQNRDSANQLMRYFATKGYNMESVCEEAAFIMQVSVRDEYDVLLLDVELARQNDWHMLNVIRTRQINKLTPIILMGDKQNIVKALAYGIVDCIPKPADKALLLAVVNGCVRRDVQNVSLLERYRGV